MCYGLRASERYGDSDVISYGQLSGDIPNIAELGELTCRDAEKCFKQVSKEVKVTYQAKFAIFSSVFQFL